MVQLPDSLGGGVIEVHTGETGIVTTPSGQAFSVQWDCDESGSLIVLDVKIEEASPLLSPLSILINTITRPITLIISLIINVSITITPTRTGVPPHRPLNFLTY